MLQIDNKVVVHFRDGRILKGYTHNFNPNNKTFHVSRADDRKEVVEVSTSVLKAAFFVKSFEGVKDHPSYDDFSLESFKNTPGTKVKVTFFDNEVIYGSTHGYSPNRKGFFIFPANKDLNNQRVFVIKEATTSVKIWR